MTNEFQKAAARQLLGEGDLFIHLDPRAPGVDVPPWLRHQAQLVLVVGYNMAIHIPDLTVDDFGISGTLSFSRTPYLCRMPWKSVFALIGAQGRGTTFDENMPAEVKADVARNEARLSWPARSEKPKSSGLTSVRGGRTGLEKRKTARGVLRSV